MHRKTKLFGLIIIALAMGSCGLFSCSPTEVTVRQDEDGEWRIYDDRGRNRGTWTVDEGAEISWEVTGSDMIFSFPTDIGNYFEFTEGFFTEIDTSYSGPGNEPRRIQKVADGNSLDLKIKEIEYDELEESERIIVEADTIDYDIYVIEAEKYVIGNSPPYLIIRRSSNH